MKAEVYSWRVSTNLKTDLEREARRRKLSVSSILELAARDWLKNSGSGDESDEEQQRLHQAASKLLGAFAGGNSRRSENVSQAVRQRLRRKQ